MTCSSLASSSYKIAGGDSWSPKAGMKWHLKLTYDLRLKHSNQYASFFFLVAYGPLPPIADMTGKAKAKSDQNLHFLSHWVTTHVYVYVRVQFTENAGDAVEKFP